MIDTEYKFELLLVTAFVLLTVAVVGPVAIVEQGGMAIKGVVGEKPEPSMENYQTVESIELVDENTLRIQFGEYVVLEQAGNRDPTVNEILLKKDDFTRITRQERPVGTKSITVTISETSVPGTYWLELRNVEEGAGGAWGPGDKIASQTLEFKITEDGDVIVTDVPDGAIYPP
jgi:hypothetical protein